MQITFSRSGMLRLLRLNRPCHPLPCPRAIVQRLHRRQNHSCELKTGAGSSTLPKPRLDYRSIAENTVYKSHNAFNRKAPLPVGAIQSVSRLYEEHKNLCSKLNERRHARSMIGDRIRDNDGKSGAQEREAARQEAKKLKSEVLELEVQVAELEEKLLATALAIPNDTHPDTPLGPESAAVILSTHGPSPLPASSSRDHVNVGRKLALFDFEAGALVTGSSWYYLLNEAALLEIAITNYALSIAMEHGFTPVTTPDVVRSDVASRCGFQPRDHSDPPVSQMYGVVTSNHADQSPSIVPELVLAGTAEIPLAGMFANKIYPASSLPLKIVGLGRAFRAEAGSRGHDTRGLYRVHQFTKLELFAVTTSDASAEMLDSIRQVQVDIFERLGMPFRVLDMPTEELGASAYRKYDMEVWMPGRGSWGEVSSASNCTDYQARRLHIRYRSTPKTSATSSPTYPLHSAGIPFAHTLNGTAAAIPRLIIALIENGARFDSDGEVVGLDLPDVLRPFWIGGNGRGIVQWYPA